ncbi:cytochrome c3 family protein [Candidatus Saganbacteria bacterium]|nr:cytochrome c3 family protein [Candidatus Saganbacteria bacterium]
MKEKLDRLFRSRLGKIALILFGLFILAILSFAHYSESPSFCNSCHIMKPYYQAWKTSKHNFVKCVDCHYPADASPKQFAWKKFQSMSQVAKYVTRTYGTRPYAEIDDSSCLRGGCHAKRLLEGKVTYKEHVVFDHGPHLLNLRQGKQLRCTSCHSQIVQGRHIEVTDSTCFICHFKKDKNGKRPSISKCSTCHKMPERLIKHGGFSFSHKDFAGGKQLNCEKCHSDSIIGEGTTSKDKCLDCHNQPDRIAKYNDTTFIHKNHVADHKIECIRCHSEIKHQLGRVIYLLESQCTVCHTKKHGGVREMYMGIGGKGVSDQPSPMFTHQVDCAGCHITPTIAPDDVLFKGQTYKTTQKSCSGCHAEAYESVLDSWKEQMDKSLNEIESKLAKAKDILAAYEEKQDKKYIKSLTLYNEAKYNYYFVKDAKGVHNIDYAEALLKKAGEDLDSIFSYTLP